MYKVLELRDNMMHAETASISVHLEHRVRRAMTRDNVEWLGRADKDCELLNGGNGIYIS